MSRPERKDGNGVWHHVMNRGIARRTVFETRRDVRFFLSRVARSVRLGLVEVHAYSILSTHFHMLIRSPHGELARAMQRIQNGYVRWFNRSRRRDGPLFRGRYRSRPVEFGEHWFTVLRYIDGNPVEAGIVNESSAYPFGSSFHYTRRERGPIWLCRSVVERVVAHKLEAPAYCPADYRAVLAKRSDGGDPASPEGLRRLAAMDDLVTGVPPVVADRLTNKARLADATEPGHGRVPVARIRLRMRDAMAKQPSWLVRSGKVQRSGWPIVEAGVLKRVCGLRYRELARQLGCSCSTVQGRVRLHDRLLETDPNYVDVVSGLVP